MKVDPRVLEINRLLKEQHNRRMRANSKHGAFDFGYGYDGDKVPDQVKDTMVAQLRAVLMTLKIEQELKKRSR